MSCSWMIAVLQSHLPMGHELLSRTGISLPDSRTTRDSKTSDILYMLWQLDGYLFKSLETPTLRKAQVLINPLPSINRYVMGRLFWKLAIIFLINCQPFRVPIRILQPAHQSYRAVLHTDRFIASRTFTRQIQENIPPNSLSNSPIYCIVLADIVLLHHHRH
jgi:hypothetical protein